MKKQLFVKKRMEIEKNLKEARDYVESKYNEENKSRIILGTKIVILNKIAILEEENKALLYGKNIKEIEVMGGEIKLLVSEKVGMIQGFHNKRKFDKKLKELYRQIDIFNWMIKK